MLGARLPQRPPADPLADVLDRPGVMAFFATHDWVASVAELQQLGVSSHAVSRARRRGVLTSPAGGVVAVAGAELTLRGRARVAVLCAGHEAFVSGPTAGALLGLRGMPQRWVEITILERRRVRPPSWCRVVRTSWLEEERDVVVTAGVRCSSPLRTLFGLASQFNTIKFARSAEDMWHLGLVAPDEADAYLQAIRRSGRTGVGRMEEWLVGVIERGRPAQSGLELDVLDVIRELALPPPVTQHPLVLRSGETIHLDIAWPPIRLALEPGHSWWHGGDLRQRRDAERDQACGEVGWAVHRFDEIQVADRDTLRSRIVGIYRERQRLFTAPA